MSKIYRILQYSTQIFIIIGFIWTILQPKSFKLEYIFLSIVSVIFLALSMVVPLISIAINMPRIYFILLVILAPFCIIGASLLWNVSTSIVKKYNWVKHKWYKKIAVIFEKKLSSHANNFYLIFNLLILIPYFLFNVGFIFAIGGYSEETRDLAKIPSSASLSYDAVDTGYYTSQEITAALRASQIIDKNSIIFGDRWEGYDLISSWHENASYFLGDLNIPTNSFVLLRKWNLDHNQIKLEIIKGHKFEYRSISTLQGNIFAYRDKIYTNGAAEILGGTFKTNSEVNAK